MSSSFLQTVQSHLILHILPKYLFKDFQFKKLVKLATIICIKQYHHTGYTATMNIFFKNNVFDRITTHYLSKMLYLQISLPVRTIIESDVRTFDILVEF